MMNREDKIAERLSKSVSANGEIIPRRLGKLVQEITEQTRHNWHGVAIKTLATELREMRVLDLMDAVDVISSYLGHVPRDLLKLQDNIRSGLIVKAQRKWGKDIGQQIYDAF